MSGITTTLDVLKSGWLTAIWRETRGTPAALQMASQTPDSLRLGWANGSQIKPKNAASTAMAAVMPMLAPNQGLRSEKSGWCSAMGWSRHKTPAHLFFLGP